ncbi:VIT1/CCC1 transporter family protein [Actibacterium sp. MT2.3-13A]|uniref:VIT1/CCC1 transporter family protein n=1 Tax=Actibacterium sp. MT2.3-13A TaxID=2828332 RepID=UPI001BA4F190|nr:VIT1/CCC1 transporter family protein [Actibacterium sp. MT2.3-13A]
MAADGPRFGRVQEFLKQIVFGGNDGIVTTFAIVAGFAGARSEGAAEIGALAVLVFGLANLFADGVSMGLGEFLSLRSQHDLYRMRHRETLRAIAQDTPAARARLSELFRKRGLNSSDAQAASAILARHPQVMAEMMMAYAHGLSHPRDQRPAANGLFTLFAFLVFGAIPLVPYFLWPATPATFQLSLLATFSALVALGVLRWHATGDAPARSILETVLVGGLCAAVAYLVGMWVGG